MKAKKFISAVCALAMTAASAATFVSAAGENVIIKGDHVSVAKGGDEFELSFINKVLKVHTRVELDVHRLDVFLGKLLQRLRTLTVDGNAKDTKLTEFNLVAVEQLLYNAVAHVRQDGFHHTSAVASVV